MISERLLQLLAKQMGRAASDEEILELHGLLQQYPEHDFLLEILQSMKVEKSHQEQTFNEDHLVQESWLMLKQEMDDIQTRNELPDNKFVMPVKTKLVRMWIGRAAVWAGIVLLAGGSFLMFKNSGKRNIQPLASKIKKVGLPYGAPVKKILPDSSVVWLNAGSRIRYDDHFVQKTRDVYLEGEAYFSVHHDAEHPFIVHAENITVRALGTRFNVKAYANENKVEATLISGKIMVKIDGKPDQSIILIPNEKLTVHNEKLELIHKNNELTKELSFEVKGVSQIPSIASVPEVAWLQDKLAFENESFGELAKRMERLYNILIFFKDTLLGAERLSGVFENESIEKAMDVLQLTTPFHYQLRGDTAVYISK